MHGYLTTPKPAAFVRISASLTSYTGGGSFKSTWSCWSATSTWRHAKGSCAGEMNGSFSSAAASFRRGRRGRMLVIFGVWYFLCSSDKSKGICFWEGLLHFLEILFVDFSLQLPPQRHHQRRMGRSHLRLRLQPAARIGHGHCWNECSGLIAAQLCGGWF